MATIPPPLIGMADSTIVQVQASHYSSLVISFLAVLDTLNPHAQVEMRQHRRHKTNGMVAWHFNLVTKYIALMLRTALLPGRTLSNYLHFIDKVVAGAVIGSTTFNLLFYLLFVSATTLCYDRPSKSHLVMRRLPVKQNAKRKLHFYCPQII